MVSVCASVTADASRVIVVSMAVINFISVLRPERSAIGLTVRICSPRANALRSRSLCPAYICAISLSLPVPLGEVSQYGRTCGGLGKPRRHVAAIIRDRG